MPGPSVGGRRRETDGDAKRQTGRGGRGHAVQNKEKTGMCALRLEIRVWRMHRKDSRRVCLGRMTLRSTRTTIIDTVEVARRRITVNYDN